MANENTKQKLTRAGHSLRNVVSMAVSCKDSLDQTRSAGYGQAMGGFWMSAWGQLKDHVFTGLVIDCMVCSCVVGALKKKRDERLGYDCFLFYFEVVGKSTRPIASCRFV